MTTCTAFTRRRQWMCPAHLRYAPPCGNPQMESSAHSVNNSTVHFVLAADPDPVNLGVLRRGTRAEGEVRISNHSETGQVISEFKTSCPCVRVKADQPVVVDSGGVVVVIVAFDPKLEPTFTSVGSSVGSDPVFGLHSV